MSFAPDHSGVKHHLILHSTHASVDWYKNLDDSRRNAPKPPPHITLPPILTTNSAKEVYIRMFNPDSAAD